MKPRYLVYDNVDDRSEIIYLLEKLPPAKRLAWLGWCCTKSAVPNSGVRPRVSAKSTGASLEVFFDLWALAAQYELDVDGAVRRLVEMVRRER